MNAIQNYVWGLSKQPQYADNETVIQITTTQPNQTFEWGTVRGPVQYYDWDNSVRTYRKSHTFVNAGTYTIKIVGNVSYFMINEHGQTSHLVTKVIHVASTINNFSWCFQGCTNITSIPSELFDKNVNVTDFTGCFYNCTSLISIPSELFDKNLNVTDFSGCFKSCTSLTSIPSGLFDKNVNVTSFSFCFHNCTSLTSIPSGLFDKNVNVTWFSNCFSLCTSLISIPSGLFDKNVNVTQFSSCFYNCTSLTNRPKPHGLEMWQIAGTNGRPSSINIIAMFTYCGVMPDYASLPDPVKRPL